MLIWPVLATLAAHEYGFAAVCFGLAGVTDLLDGYLAKRFGWTSELGKWLDPVGDKCLLVTVFVAAAWAGLVPRWLTAAVVARDVAIALGALTYLAGSDLWRAAPPSPASSIRWCSWPTCLPSCCTRRSAFRP